MELINSHHACSELLPGLLIRQRHSRTSRHRWEIIGDYDDDDDDVSAADDDDDDGDYYLFLYCYFTLILIKEGIIC